MVSDTGPGSDQAPRKTLEDIRRELDAEYPPPAPVERPHEIAVEPHRPAPRRGAGRRGPVMAAAIGCIVGQVLLVVAYVAVMRYADNTTALPPTVLAPAPAPRVDPQLETLRTDLHSLAVKLERAESRVTGAESRVRGVESRVNGVESSMRRLGDDVASAAAQTRQVERALSAAPRQIAAKPAPPAPLPPARAPLTATVSERWISSEQVAPPSPPPPHQGRPLAETLAPTALSAPPQPRRESSQSPETKAPTTDSASSSDTPPTLKDKLRDDWRSIKQGFASAGDDFKATMRDFARKVRGE